MPRMMWVYTIGCGSIQSFFHHPRLCSEFAWTVAFFLLNVPQYSPYSELWLTWPLNVYGQCAQIYGHCWHCEMKIPDTKTAWISGSATYACFPYQYILLSVCCLVTIFSPGLKNRWRINVVMSVILFPLFVVPELLFLLDFHVYYVSLLIWEYCNTIIHTCFVLRLQNLPFWYCFNRQILPSVPWVEGCCTSYRFQARTAMKSDQFQGIGSTIPT